MPSKKGVSVLKFLQGYYPFGGTFNSWTNTTPRNNYTFNGNEEQVELEGLMDFNARFYDPYLGRFINIDPLADLQSDFNPYHFSYNNPITLNDPTGLMPELIFEEYEETHITEGKTGAPINTGRYDRPNDNFHGEFNYIATCPKCPKNSKNEDLILNNSDSNSSTRAGDIMIGTMFVTGGLFADNATIIGFVDDVLIPFVIIGGSLTAAGVYVYDEIAEKGPIFVHSKGGRQNIWPDQYGSPPRVGDVDWDKSDSELANDVSDANGDTKKGPKSPNNQVKKWFRDKRPK